MDHPRVGTDLLNHRSGDFGSPRAIGRVRTTMPVCIDALGETWAGYIAEGPEKGRMVLVTRGTIPSDLQDRERFFAHLNASIEVRHPQALAPLEVVRDGDSFALVSEYLEGEPLSTLMRSAEDQSVPIPQGVALAIVRETIEALVSLRNKYAEAATASALFPFGGLCPGAIFVAAFGETMLRSPGIEAYAVTSKAILHHPSALPYRAPEELRAGDPVREAAEVFSVGVILWELLAGRPLFGGRSHISGGRRNTPLSAEIEEMRARVLELPVPSLKAIQRHGGALHPAVIDLVASALCREISERPSSLSDFGALIDSLPPGLVASSVEIAATVEKLAGKAIQKREHALRDGAPVPVYGSKPPSNRVTSAPEGGARASLEIPRGENLDHLGDLLRPTEAPPPPGAYRSPKEDSPDQSRSTAPSRPRAFELFEAETKAPKYARKRPPAAPSSRVEPPAGSPLIFEDPSAADSGEEHCTRTPQGHLIPVLEKKTGKRGGGLWFVALLLLFVVSGAYLTVSSRLGNKGESAARSSTAVEDPAEAQSESPSLGASEAPSRLPEAGGRKDQEPSDPAAAGESPTPTPPNEPEAEGPPPPSVGQKKARPRPLPQKKASEESPSVFRPMGI